MKGLNEKILNIIYKLFKNIIPKILKNNIYKKKFELFNYMDCRGIYKLLDIILIT